jgi:hypothetical protein
MSTHIFNLGDLSNFEEKINLDELYEKKKEKDDNKLEIYNKLLNRIHKKIKVTSRNRVGDQHCWFVVPEVMIGISNYDQSACIGYLVHKLNDNGFVCRYLHPNLLFISWKHWVPNYVRTEIKKRAGVNIDGYGNVIHKKEQPLKQLINNNKSKGKQYKSILDYKPSGNLFK